jgi:predicted PurR-regulated permease PerM
LSDKYTDFIRNEQLFLFFILQMHYGLFLLVNRLSAVLLPFLVAWLLAYMIHPLVGVFQYKLKIQNRVFSIILALLLIGVVLVGVVWLVFPPIIGELTRTTSLFSVYIKQIQEASFIPNDMKAFLVDWMHKIDFEKLLKQESVSEGVKSLVPRFGSIILGSLDFVISLLVVVIVFLYTIFILVDYEKITNGWIELVPSKFRLRIMDMVGDLESGMNRYFRGQALIATIVGVLFAIGFEIIDLPLGILMGLLIGALTMVPYLKVIMILPMGFVALLKSIETGQPYWMVALSIVAIFILIQAFEDIVLIPKIMGKAMGMNPAVILLSLSIWGSLMGVAGMIIALPITTIIVSYYKRFILGDEALFYTNEPSVVAVKKTVTRKSVAKSTTRKSPRKQGKSKE